MEAHHLTHIEGLKEPEIFNVLKEQTKNMSFEARVSLGNLFRGLSKLVSRDSNILSDISKDSDITTNINSQFAAVIEGAIFAWKLIRVNEKFLLENTTLLTTVLNQYKVILGRYKAVDILSFLACIDIDTGTEIPYPQSIIDILIINWVKKDILTEEDELVDKIVVNHKRNQSLTYEFLLLTQFEYSNAIFKRAPYIPTIAFNIFSREFPIVNEDLFRASIRQLIINVRSPRSEERNG